MKSRWYCKKCGRIYHLENFLPNHAKLTKAWCPNKNCENARLWKVKEK